nr:coiled-coil domain-containing protein 13-like isoform X2 [Physcomitrium patens]|eukprot:XP_024390376.1 coiled-coil domain-containing protein 13-like isoform X2 [Physcomitrella patens]
MSAPEELTNVEKKCKEQAEEISKLREVLAIIGSGEGDLREVKILELFKKNRLLNLQLERERTRNNNTRRAVAVMQQEMLNMQSAKPPESSIKESTDDWEDKFHRVKHKLEIIQANESILEKQVQRLHHVLQREVGEHIPLAKVVEEGTGWVGRSELISKLKGKVEELKAQVKILQPAPLEGYTTIKNDEHHTVEILHRNELERLDVERRLQYDKLIHDFLTLRASWGMQKKRLDGVIARRNILEKELTSAKSKLQILLTKSINDDTLIQALTIELAAAKQANGPPFPKPGGPLQLDHHARCHKLAASFHELKSQCHIQEICLKNQEEIIQTFQDTIEDPSCDDWCTAELYQESHQPEVVFVPVEAQLFNNDRITDPPCSLEALCEQFE